MEIGLQLGIGTDLIYIPPCPIHDMAVAVKEKVRIISDYKIKDLKDLGSVMKMMEYPG